MTSLRNIVNLSENNNIKKLIKYKKEFITPNIKPYKTFLSCMDDG
jgi:hypothetical protein